MIYFFLVPEVVDKSDLNKLPKNKLGPNEEGFLKSTNELRLQFKELCRFEKVQELRNLGDGLVNDHYVMIVENYFKTNIDLVIKLLFLRDTQAPEAKQ